MQKKQTRHFVLKFFANLRLGAGGEGEGGGKIFIYICLVELYCAKQLNSSKKLCKFEKRISIVNLAIRQRNIFRYFSLLFENL